MKICGIFCGCNHFVTTISCVWNIEYRGMLFLSSPSFPIRRISRNYFSAEIPQVCKLPVGTAICRPLSCAAPVGIDYARRDNRSAARQRKRAVCTVGASTARPLSCAAPRRDRLCPKGQSIRRPAAEKGRPHRRGEQCSPAGPDRAGSTVFRKKSPPNVILSAAKNLLCPAIIPQFRFFAALRMTYPGFARKL